MKVREFLIHATLCNILSYLTVSGQTSESISRVTPEYSKDGKVTVNFGDLVIEVKPPCGREGNVNTEPVYQKWQNSDDVGYWKSIYGGADNIPAFEDFTEILGETVKLKYVESEESLKNFSQPLAEKPSDPSVGEIKSAAIETVSRSRRNIVQDRCQLVNPLHFMRNPWNREKQETKDTKDTKRPGADSDKTFIRDLKRKGRNLSESRSRISRRLDYLFNKYESDSHLCKSGFESLENGTKNDDIIIGTKSEGYINETINTGLGSLKSGLVNSARVVSDTIPNVTKKLMETEHKVIDLGHQVITQPIVSRNPKNTATDRLEKGVVVNPNPDISVEFKASLDMGISVGIKRSVDTHFHKPKDADTIVTGMKIVRNPVVPPSKSKPSPKPNAKHHIVLTKGAGSTKK